MDAFCCVTAQFRGRANDKAHDLVVIERLTAQGARIVAFPDDGEVRTGNAMILDPYGRILAETWKA